ncbi:MAG: aminopeptidase P family protein [Desulfobacteraceae bacterium]
MKSMILLERLSAGQRLLETCDCDAFLVSCPENRRYLSGFSAQEAQLNESCGYLLFSADTAWLLTDFRYREWAAQEAPYFEVIVYPEGLAKVLPDLLQRLACRRLGFEAPYLSFYQYQKLAEAVAEAGLEVEWQPLDGVLEELREVKDAEELDSLKQALNLTEAGLAAIQAQLHEGQTEQEIAWMIECRLRQSGAEALSFPTIVASGPNSSRPHHHPGDRPIQAGEPIIIDLGARWRGYCADMTRTFVLGEPDEKFKEIYSLVRAAQKTAEEGIRAGMMSDEADALARQVISAPGYGDYFGHSLGHGVGLAVHERPSLSPVKERATILKTGMVTTVEPGIYLPGWGGVRLEDMIRIEEDGAAVLNADRNFYRFA